MFKVTDLVSLTVSSEDSGQTDNMSVQVCVLLACLLDKHKNLINWPWGYIKNSCSTHLAPEVIKFLPCSTQLSLKFNLLINVKMTAIVGILTFISMINTTSERLK